MGETEHNNAFKFIIRLRSYTRLQKGGNAGNVFPANLRFLQLFWLMIYVLLSRKKLCLI